MVDPAAASHREQSPLPCTSLVAQEMQQRLRIGAPSPVGFCEQTGAQCRFVSQEGVQNPAPFMVWPGAATMFEDGLIATTHLLQQVCQSCKRLERSFAVKFPGVFHG